MVEIGRDLLHFESKRDGKVYYAYLWKKPEGNILFNHIPHLSFWKNQLDHIEQVGGVKWVYLTHAGDADDGTSLFHKTFGAQLAGEEYEGQKARKKCKVPLGRVIDSKNASHKSLECINAPGHCPTFLAFRFGGAKVSYLYTSDMFFQASESTWKVTIPERMAQIGLRSIENLFSKPFNYLLPGLSGEGGSAPIKMDSEARKQLMEALQSTLRKKYKIPVSAKA